MRDKISLHQYVLFGTLAILILWKIVTRNFSFDLGLLWWLLGAIIGFLFVFTDRFVYSFLMKPEEALGKRLKDLFDGKRFNEGLYLILNERHEQRELIMRSFLFIIDQVKRQMYSHSQHKSSPKRTGNTGYSQNRQYNPNHHKQEAPHN